MVLGILPCWLFQGENTQDLSGHSCQISLYLLFWRYKGDRFERLIQAFLQAVPWYAGVFQHVWLWQEFPYRESFGGKDTGIDIVAQTAEGDFWAIQCKCYDEKAHIDKPAVDSFLATSSKQLAVEDEKTKTFSLRLWISTTSKWGSEAENTIRNQEPPVQRINLADLNVRLQTGMLWNKAYAALKPF